MTIFSSARLKLKRARQIIDELDTMLAEHMQANPPKIEFTGTTPDAKGTWYESRFTVPNTPEMAPTLIGDVIHNVRTSLDHMASEMARMNGKSDKHVHFPFAEDAGQLDTMIKKKNFDFCGQDAVDLLKTFKPYRHGNVELRTLHDLDILDKHRDLVPEAYVAGNLKVTMPLGPAAVSVADGAQFVFPKELGLGTQPLVKTLKDLVDLCEGVLEAFAALKTGNDGGADGASGVAAKA